MLAAHDFRLVSIHRQSHLPRRLQRQQDESEPRPHEGGFGTSVCATPARLDLRRSSLAPVHRKVRAHVLEHPTRRGTVVQGLVRVALADCAQLLVDLLAERIPLFVDGERLEQLRRRVARRRLAPHLHPSVTLANHTVPVGVEPHALAIGFARVWILPTVPRAATHVAREAERLLARPLSRAPVARYHLLERKQVGIHLAQAVGGAGVFLR